MSDFSRIKVLYEIVLNWSLELDREVKTEEVAPILVEKLSKHLRVPISDFDPDSLAVQ